MKHFWLIFVLACLARCSKPVDLKPVKGSAEELGKLTSIEYLTEGTKDKTVLQTNTERRIVVYGLVHDVTIGEALVKITWEKAGYQDRDYVVIDETNYRLIR